MVHGQRRLTITPRIGLFLFYFRYCLEVLPMFCLSSPWFVNHWYRGTELELPSSELLASRAHYKCSSYNAAFPFYCCLQLGRPWVCIHTVCFEETFGNSFKVYIIILFEAFRSEPFLNLYNGQAFDFSNWTQQILLNINSEPELI